MISTQKLPRKIVTFLVIVVFLFLIVSIFSTAILSILPIPKSIFKIRDDGKEIKSLEENSIFFLETNYQINKVNLSRRQACSIESAARMHPNRTIYLLHVTQEDVDCKKDNLTITCALLAYGNVQFVPLNVNRFFVNTPAQDFANIVLARSGQFATTHLSDLLRFVVLYKYGGIYFDMDVLVLKPFDNIAKNFVGLENDMCVGSAVLGFSNRGNGHKYAEWCINDYIANYNPLQRESNGPDLLERVLTKICEENFCKDLKTYEPSYFFPIRWQDWDKYFYQYFSPKETEELKRSHMIHLWNFHSERSFLSLKSNSVYVVLAKEFCPEVIKRIDDGIL